MSIHYKFKSTLEFDTVTFDGLHISVADLKKAIFHQKRIGKNTDFDLQITNAQTKEDYTDDNALIAKNTSLIIARVPLTQQKKTWNRAEALNSNTTKEDANLGKSIDLTRLDGSEEDKIRAMMTQSTQDYDPSNYMKIRGSTQTGEVPSNYRCYKCHQPGHWIKNCPLGNNLEPIEIKKSTGIPRSFMVPVEGPTVPGAMMTPGGTYAVPAIDHQAYKEGKKEKPPFSQEQQPQVEKPEIPEDLLCNICKDLLTDAVMIPCCGNSFCDECIRTHLLDSEDHECPDCSEKDVSPDSLIPNRYLRTAVLNFKNETGYAKSQTQSPNLKTRRGSASDLSEQAASVPTSGRISSQNELPIKEAEKAPEAKKVLRTKKSATSGAPESTPESEHQSDATAKDDETEVLPPGTEPAVLPKRLSSDHSWVDSSHDGRDDDYWYSKERRRSFSKEHGRDRHGYLSNRVESTRPPSRRRSLSPRNNQSSDYHHFEKPYPAHIPSDGRYHPPMPPMHYDPNLRTSVDNRAGTPTVDEPHLHAQSMMAYVPPDGVVPQVSYAPAVAPATAPIISDPYMVHQQRMPIYPPHQSAPPHVYVAPPRYDRYQPGYRPSQPRGYAGPRPARGMHSRYRMNLPPGLARTLHNGVQGLIDDPLEAFNRMLREKDERERRAKHRKRSRSRTRSRSYSRSRSRSYGRVKTSRSRSPPPKRRSTRSPPSHKNRSRTPKHRSRSKSFSLSRSRSYSRSPSPRKRDRDHDRPRDPLPRYKSPGRSPTRYHKDKPRSSRDYAYYPSSTALETSDYQAPYRDAGRPRYPPRISSQPIPPVPSSMLVPHVVGVPMAPTVQPPAVPPHAVMGHLPPDGKDYYDSYNRYPAAGAPRFPPGPPIKSFPDVAPPGTEGYYDVPPPGVDQVAPIPHKTLDKDHDGDRSYDREDRERRSDREKDDRDKSDRKDDRDRRDAHKDVKHSREYDKDRREYEKDRYKDDREKHNDDKRRRSDRREREYEYEKEGDRHRHERYERLSTDKKRSKRSSSPYSLKYRGDGKESSPDRHKKKEKDHEEKPEERRKEKKIKEKKKKKDSEEKKKKKKKEKKANFQKEAIAAAAAAAAAVSSIPVVLKVKQEPDDDMRTGNGIPKTEPDDLVRIKTEPPDNPPPVKSHSVPTIRSVMQIPNLIRIQTKPMPILPAKLPEKISQEMMQQIVSDTKEQTPETQVSKESQFETEPEAETVAEQEIEGPSGIEYEEEYEQEVDEEAEGEGGEEAEGKEEDEEEETAEQDAEIDGKQELDSEEHAGLVKETFSFSQPSDYDEAKTPSEPVQDEDQTEETLQLNESNEYLTDHEELALMAEQEVLEQEQSKLESDEGEEGEILEDDIEGTAEENKENVSGKDVILATIPEPSKWEKEDATERNDDEIELHANEKFLEKEEEVNKSSKIVTNEVLKRAENAIFQKAINAIRPLEVKKTGESRKVLYHSPDSKIIEIESDHETQEPRKNVNVTVSIGKNERSVEFRPAEGSSRRKSDKSKTKTSTSPARPSIKDRLGDKVEGEDAKITSAHKLLFSHRGDLKEKGSKSSRSPRLSRRISISMDDEPIITNTDRKVIIETGDRKRDRSRRDRSGRKVEDSLRIHDRTETRKVERIVRTPPLSSFKSRKDSIDEKDDRRKDKKILKDDRKRKKEHRSRSKSKERKKRKDRRHRREKEHAKADKYGREKDSLKDKDEKNTTKSSDLSDQIIDVETYKKQRRNVRIIGDRKKVLIDDVEPEYSASLSETDDDDKDSSLAKRAKLVDNTVIIESDVKPLKKRIKPSSSDEEESSSSEESSTESDSSVETHRKKKKKHKKRKKRKIRKETSSESDAYSDSSESSSEEEKHRKKKKSKGKNKTSKKKKKSKHK